MEQQPLDLVQLQSTHHWFKHHYVQTIIICLVYLKAWLSFFLQNLSPSSLVHSKLHSESILKGIH